MVVEENVKTVEVRSQAEERKSCGKWKKTLGNAELYPCLWKKPEVNGKNVNIKTALKTEVLVEKFLPEVWFNYKTQWGWPMGLWSQPSSSENYILGVSQTEKTT